MFAGGKVANSGVNWYIYGGNNGVWAQVSTAAVSNQGVILGGGNGVLLAVGGSVTNIGGRLGTSTAITTASSPAATPSS